MVREGADLFRDVHRDIECVYAIDGEDDAHASKIEGIGPQTEMHGQLVDEKVGTVTDDEKGGHLGMGVEPSVEIGGDVFLYEEDGLVVVIHLHRPAAREALHRAPALVDEVDLEVAGENAWEELKVGAEKSWKALSQAFDKASSHFKK